MDSILNTTKKILGIQPEYTAFDLDIITHINSAFSSLNQIGIGPDLGYAIDSDSQLWEELALPMNQLSMVKTYIWLKVKLAFDPPTTSFLLDAMKTQIAEQEWRLNMAHEALIPTPVPDPNWEEHQW